MDHSENLLFNRLDQPLRFLGVNKDEAFVLMGPLLMGFFMGYVLSGVLLGISFLSIYRSLKKRNEESALRTAMYWYLPSSRRSMKLYVPSYIREYIG
jgi:type IV conjugative transfer system protein TraL